MSRLSSFRPTLTSLDARLVPATLTVPATVQVSVSAADEIVIVGTNQNDVIQLKHPYDDAPEWVQVWVNGTSERYVKSPDRVVVHGNGGNDSISGFVRMPVVAYGDDGRDTLMAAGANDDLYGGAGEDYLSGGDGDDDLFGGDDKDQLIGGNGSDELYGGWGNDVMEGKAGNDYLSGGGDNDRMFGGDGDDEMRGGSGDDVMYGNWGLDKLYGESDDDTLDGGLDLSNDRLDGGSGVNVFICWSSLFVKEETIV